ncbi:hypothetical protein ACHWQZ_G018799 [Mnemiopsis leidyi]
MESLQSECKPMEVGNLIELDQAEQNVNTPTPEDDHSSLSDVLLMPCEDEFKGVLERSNSWSPCSWDTTSFKSIEVELGLGQADKPANPDPPMINLNLNDDLATLRNYITHLVTVGPVRSERDELQALDQQLMRCIQLYPDRVDKPEMEAWGQAVREMATMGNQYPGLDRNSEIPINWTRILDGAKELPRYKPARKWSEFRPKISRELAGNLRAESSQASSTKVPVVSQNQTRANDRTSVVENPSNNRISQLLGELGTLKTEHIGNLDVIDKSLKAMKAKRAEMLMAFNAKRQRLERDLKKARELREQMEMKRADTRAAQSTTPAVPVLTTEVTQGEGLAGKIASLRSALANLTDSASFTRGKINLVKATAWNESSMSEIVSPPAPDYFRQGRDDKIITELLPEELVRKTARRVYRTVSHVLDCEPETVGEAITVIQRLSATVELQGCETCSEMSNEEYSDTLKAAIPLQEMTARPSRVSRLRVRTATGHVRKRTLEFVRASSRMVLGLEGHNKNDPLDLYHERFIRAMKDLLRRLWWLLNLNVSVEETAALVPVQHYHSA